MGIGGVGWSIIYVAVPWLCVVGGGCSGVVSL